MAKLIRQSCGELQPAVCLSRGYAAIWRWPVHSWTSDKPQKQATEKQAGQLSASIPGWIVSQRVQLSFDGEKCVLLLCAWKPVFLRSGHICWLLLCVKTLQLTNDWLYTSIIIQYCSLAVNINDHTSIMLEIWPPCK